MKYLKLFFNWIVDFFRSLFWIVKRSVNEITETHVIAGMSAIIVVLSLIIFVGSDRAFEPGPTRLVDPAGRVEQATMAADLAAVCNAEQPAFSLTVDGQTIELFISE